MNITNKKLLKAILIVILIIILLLIFFLLFSGKVFSKYKEEINISNTTEVAKPIFIVDGADNIVIDGIEDTVYNFSVKNYDDENISDTGMDYYITITNNSNANLTFELTKDGNLVNLDNNTTSSISLSSLNKQEDLYALKIKYEDDSLVTNDIKGNVQIKVKAEQSVNN